MNQNSFDGIYTSSWAPTYNW